MKPLKFLLILPYSVFSERGQLCSDPNLEQQAAEFFKNHDIQLNPVDYQVGQAQWEYYTNITTSNSENSVKMMQIYAEQAKKLAMQARNNFLDCTDKFSNKTLKRGIDKLFSLGDTILSDSDFENLLNLKNQLKSHYSTLEVEGLKLEPGITHKFNTVDDFYELKHYWQLWFDGFKDQKDTGCLRI